MMYVTTFSFISRVLNLMFIKLVENVKELWFIAADPDLQ